MFEQLITALSQPSKQNALGHAQQMMESTSKLTKSQMSVMEGLLEEVMQGYRDTLSSGDPSAILKNWPTLMSNAVRANTEAAALMVKNANEFQREVFQQMPNLQPDFLGQITKGMMEVVRPNDSTRQAARAKKAA